MKRGLVVLDPAEIPTAEWGERVRAVQAELRAAGVDVALVYNDVSRGDDIGYLTNLVIYWNEGMLAIPAEGEATLLTKLSKRVFSWMQKTSVLEDLRSGQTLGKLVAGYVADRPAGTIGFIDADLWPAAYVDEIAAAVPEWTTVELGPLVRDARKILSPAELGVIRSAAGVLRDALAAADTGGLDVRDRMGALESVARHGGFTDVLLRGTEADGHATIETAGEYRQSWLLTGRTYGDAAFLGSLADAQRAALAALAPGVAWPRVEAAALAALALPDGATAVVTWSSQADFANRGELRPTSPVGPAAGEVAALQLEVIEAGGRRSVLTDTFLTAAGGAELLTA
ncbi:MAG TPA: aminopeptidase P family N-terminal domain-containing protein [Trebonia sp.]|nr:aminopeptidase P family N-terminal domain-containing protein [Trebonia sp.]